MALQKRKFKEETCKIHKQHPVFLAAVYMDPRINYAGSDFLKEDQLKTAMVIFIFSTNKTCTNMLTFQTHILRLWEKLKSRIEETNNLPNSAVSSTEKPTSKIEHTYTSGRSTKNDRAKVERSLFAKPHVCRFLCFGFLGAEKTFWAPPIRAGSSCLGSTLHSGLRREGI